MNSAGWIPAGACLHGHGRTWTKSSEQAWTGDDGGKIGTDAAVRMIRRSEVVMSIPGGWTLEHHMALEKLRDGDV